MGYSYGIYFSDEIINVEILRVNLYFLVYWFFLLYVRNLIYLEILIKGGFY